MRPAERTAERTAPCRAGHGHRVPLVSGTLSTSRNGNADHVNITRGFTGRPRVHNPGLPPGQYDAGDEWPVLSAEVTPT